MFSFFQSNRPSVVIGGILVLTFLIYSPAIFHEFVNLDDPARITNNPLIRSLSWENVHLIFTSLVAGLYTPLTTLSFALEHHFVGLNPVLYHLNNILLHLGVVFLVFRLGMILGLKTIWAGLAALIFSVHPMHVESVAWVSERKDVLYGVLYMGAVVSYLSYLKTKSPRAFWLSVALGLLSMLAKAMAVSLPLVLLLCDWFTKKSLRREDWLSKLPYALYLVPLAWVSFVPSVPVLTCSMKFDPLLRIWCAGFYLKKFLWPFPLVPHYIPSTPAHIFHPEYASAILILGISVFAAWRNRWFRFALLWWFLSIFLLLNFQAVMHKVADRYMYLPSVGFCFFAGYVVQSIWENQRYSSAARRAVLYVMIALVLVLSVKTFSQIGIWKDSFSLWNHTVQKVPRSHWAYNYRGRIFFNRKQFQLAKADFIESIRLYPYFEKAYINLALVYEREGNIPAALENYSKVLFLNPKNKVGLNNRGLLYQKAGNTAAALSDFEAVIAVDPRNPVGYGNRGALFLQLEKFKPALDDLTRAVELNPDYLDGYLNRSACYLRMNLLNEAVKDCYTAVRLNAVQSQRLFLSPKSCQVMGERGLVEERPPETDDPGESPF